MKRVWKWHSHSNNRNVILELPKICIPQSLHAVRQGYCFSSAPLWCWIDSRGHPCNNCRNQKQHVSLLHQLLRLQKKTPRDTEESNSYLASQFTFNGNRKFNPCLQKPELTPSWATYSHPISWPESIRNLSQDDKKHLKVAYNTILLEQTRWNSNAELCFFPN